MIAGRLLLTAALVVAPSVAPTKNDDIDIPCLKRQIASCDEAFPGSFNTAVRGWCYILAVPSCNAS